MSEGFGLARLKIPGAFHDYDTGENIFPDDPRYAALEAEADKQRKERAAQTAADEAFMERIGDLIFNDPSASLSGEDLKRLHAIAMRVEL